ncbi:hypothetical protein H9P43_001133 [Blastocladiella emersonii ATCC 22665]|nr:hypothetical protein H9P43_001133 [Blastocladiella emersonii ATCC 22665]
MNSSRRLVVCLVVVVLVLFSFMLSGLAPDAGDAASMRGGSAMAQLRPAGDDEGFEVVNPGSSSSSGATGAIGGIKAALPAGSASDVMAWIKSKTPSFGSSGTERGSVIMPKMGNETLRAELGHSSWHLIHTMGNTYPHKPKADEREAMRTFIYLIGRLYPCGECAEHFQQMLAVHPPEPHLGSRDELSQYLCKLHNKVNLRLGHAIFDCNKVGDRWKCGCADADDDKDKDALTKPAKHQRLPHVPPTADNGKFGGVQTNGSMPIPDVVGKETAADDEDEEEDPELANLTPLERAMRMEFRSMFPEDYEAALKGARAAPPTYPAKPRNATVEASMAPAINATVVSSSTASRRRRSERA